MTYNKEDVVVWSNSDKRASGLFLQAGKTENTFARNFADQVPQLYYLGLYCTDNPLSGKSI